MKVYIIDGKPHTIAELAMRKNTSSQCIYQYFKNHKRKYPDKTPDEIAKLVLDYTPLVINKKFRCPDGKYRTYTQIGEMLGVARETISKRMRMYGEGSSLVFVTKEEAKEAGREKRAITIKTHSPEPKYDGDLNKLKSKQDEEEALRIRTLLRAIPEPTKFDAMFG